MTMRLISVHKSGVSGAVTKVFEHLGEVGKYECSQEKVQEDKSWLFRLGHQYYDVILYWEVKKAPPKNSKLVAKRNCFNMYLGKRNVPSRWGKIEADTLYFVAKTKEEGR